MSLHKITFLLLIVGGLNWLAEAFGFGIGQYLPFRLAQLVYILVGLSAVWELLGHKKLCKECGAGSMGGQM
ncbi:MAG TPA: DUF378 domain-containing protein [Candidatus Paceibacterota bacterium]|nr:DUF378 domain-containing protein [Candidatus Paceibacterota bacterium]